MAIITTMEEALAYAATKLGYELLKTKQNEAVKAFVGGNDAFVSLVVGSLCASPCSDNYVFDYLS